MNALQNATAREPVRGLAVNRTSIEWTAFTANPLRYRDATGRVVWACVHYSPGCLNCYAEALAKRRGRGGPFNVQTMSQLTPFLDERELRQMAQARCVQGLNVTGQRCFVGDMTDLFGEWMPDSLLDQLYTVLEQRRDVTWQILTKRAGRMQQYLSLRYRNHTPKHIWHGVSAEDQPRLDARLSLLLRTPSAVRFLSMEPLLAAVNPRLHQGFCRACLQYTPGTIDGHCFDPASACFSGEMAISDGIDWVIVGGESRAITRARPLNVEWVRRIVQQCARTGVPVFVKQLGSFVVDRNDSDFDGSSDHAWPVAIEERDAVAHHIDGFREDHQGAPVRVRLVSRKGGAVDEWPPDLRVRQFPLRPGRQS